ncbi:hypothetical protein [Bradyrhizobium iriomotense]|uniref:hypothetical protein n=1 Tax=Bradyrhizobium iriomotense TaxID=441950 RepID=UPI003D663DDB
MQERSIGMVLARLGYRPLSLRPALSSSRRGGSASIQRVYRNRCGGSPPSRPKQADRNPGSSVWFASGVQEEATLPRAPAPSCSACWSAEFCQSHNGSRRDAFLARHPDLSISCHHQTWCSRLKQEFNK